MSHIENDNFLKFLNKEISFNAFISTFKDLRTFESKDVIFSFFYDIERFLLNNKKTILQGNYSQKQLFDLLIKNNQEIYRQLYAYSSNSNRNGENDGFELNDISLAKKYCDNLVKDISNFILKDYEPEHNDLTLEKLSQFYRDCYSFEKRFANDRNASLKFYKFFYPNGMLNGVRFDSVDSKQRYRIIERIMKSKEFSNLKDKCKYLNLETILRELKIKIQNGDQYFVLLEAFFLLLRQGKKVDETFKYIENSKKRLAETHGFTEEIFNLAYQQVIDNHAFVFAIIKFLENKKILIPRK